MSDNLSSSRGTRRKPLWITLLIVALVAIAAFWWYKHHQNGKASAAAAAGRNGQTIAVGAATVARHDVELELVALGTVTSTYTVTVHSRVDGQLDKVHFTEGQLVKQGQLLAELDPRPYQAALTQAQGQLLRDQALLRNAELDLARYRQLLDQNSIAKQIVDTQDALVRQYQGTVKIDQGAVDNAKLQLDYSRVTAPITGRAGLRQIDPGNIVHSSDANGLVIITQNQPINVLFALPEVSLEQVLRAMRQNPSLKVEAWDRNNLHKLTDGNLMALDNQLNTLTGTVNLKARFANEREQLFPNQFINVRLQLGAEPDVLTVPTVALQLGTGGSYVYVVNADETVSIAKVKPGQVSGNDTIIEQGLKEGQKVVVDGLDKLREGSKVRVIDRAAQNQAAAAAAASPSPARGQRRRRNGAEGQPGEHPAGSAPASAPASENPAAAPAQAPAAAAPAPAPAPAR
ncbi:MdtA/MuxA family multidrug efflux RND transporter periplasmic adaptor subunit [Oxalobacteraceae bacterium CAVE-383]|nr:MdtA/MuxA family multidrug efflux RND transporter periplasmic adaptor subunit [Oxalobacteraceae bacterium CAVE-383]